MINKIKTWYRRQGLATKHFLFLFLVTSTMFTALAWNNLQDSKDLFEKQVIQDSQELISQTNEHLNTYLDNTQHILLFLSVQHSLLDKGKEDEAANFLKAYGDINNSYTKTLYLIRKDGKVFSNRQVNYDIVGNSYITELIKLSTNYSSGIYWSEPYDTPLSGQTVAFICPIRGENHEFKGLAVVEVNLKQLTQKISPLFKSNNQTFVVTTSSKNIVTRGNSSRLIPYDQTVYPAKIESSFIGKLGDLTTGVNQLQHEDLSLVAVKSNVNKFGWQVISLIDKKSFYQNLFHLYQNFGQAAILWTTILLLSSLLLSRHFTLPIRRLVSVMDHVKDLDVLPKMDVEREDEIGHLARSYNDMMKRIRALFNEVKELEIRKKDYELRMLQSQISPHFLYNTLACIKSLARQQKIDEVRKTIHSLIGLLSFSFNKTSELVHLNEEVDGLKKYMQIQQVRYGNQFELKLHVDPDLLDLKILKLLLQPLVENSIFHGILPKGTSGTIWIYGDKKDNHLRLYIRDNGAGIDPELQKELLTKKMKESSKHGFNSIGLINVHERIKIHYGQEYGLRIKSKKNIGTIIRLELPMIKK